MTKDIAPVICGRCGVKMVWRRPWGLGKPGWVHSKTHKFTCQDQKLKVACNSFVVAETTV